LAWMRHFILSQNFSSQLHEDLRDTAIAARRIAEIESRPHALVEGRELETRLSRIDSAKTKL
jgi:hypothetical protein